MPFGDTREDFISPLDHPLRTDILPVAGGQSAPADQVFFFPAVEVFRLRPLADHIAVGHDHQRGISVGLQHADWLAGLHQQGLVFTHGF
ncbi:hypothetical protein D3C76_1580390 [compost metagenome]